MYVPPPLPPRAWVDKRRAGPPCVLYPTLHPISHPAHPLHPKEMRHFLSKVTHTAVATRQRQGRVGAIFFCLLHADLYLFLFQGGLINFEKRRKVRALSWQLHSRADLVQSLCQSLWG